MKETGSKAVGWNHPGQESVQSEPFPEGCRSRCEASFAGVGVEGGGDLL